MPADITMHKGDSRPYLNATLKDGAGQPLDLTRCTVQFRASAGPGTTRIIDSACVVVDAPSGRVKYVWGPTDTQTLGTFQAYFLVTFPDLSVETVPKDPLTLAIVPSL
jgi:hypothetical protein